jgi:outer membrane immunogenic protein
MKKRMVIAFFATSLTAGASFAADWPLMGPQLYPSAPRMAVDWTGINFGVNAGYGWAQGSSNTAFAGGSSTQTNLAAPSPLGPGLFFPAGATTPFGATELGGTGLSSSSSPRGGIAGGQIGFNWQAGMVVFGAELDAQWSGQSNTVSVICTAPTSACTASEAIKIRSLTTGRARIGLAFDWLMPYVTAGGALVNARDDLTVTVGGVTASFLPLSGTTLGWTAGAGVDFALSSNWSARLEYLHIRANGVTSSVTIPGFIGNGTAAETASYRDNIVRVGLNYRIGPRGGPGVLETRVLPGSAYALNYDFLPSVAIPSDKAKSVTRPHDGTAVAQQSPEQAVAMPSDKAKSVTRPYDGTVVAVAGQAPQVASQPSQAAQQAPQQAAPIASEPKTSQRSAKNFLEIGDVDDLDGLSAEPEPPKLPSKKRREKEEDESQRLKRIMAICAGC